jgi:radical SAM protein with 4Fe4S-binding SPASM domain
VSGRSVSTSRTTDAGVPLFDQPDKHSGDHKVFLFQINVTRDCNLRCSHCYISSEVKALSQRLTVSNFLKIVKDIGDHMVASDSTHAEIHVVGGEPTLLGAAFYHRVMEEAHDIMKSYGDKFTWEFILVSNLLTRELMEIAPWFNKISTAYEPETRFPKPFHEKWWLSNVHALQEAGLDVCITTCVTKPVVEYGARRLCDRLYQDLGIKQIHYGFYIDSGDGRINSDTVTPGFENTSNFLIESASWYFERRDQDPDLYVNPAESMLSAIHRGDALDDIICPIISGSLDIDSNGAAMTCLQEGGELDAAWEGNVIETSVSDVINSDAFKKRKIQAARPHRSCMTCDEYQVCRSGCGVNFKSWDPDRDGDCPGYKKFIKHMRNLHQNGVMPRHAEYRSKIAF